MTNMNINTIKTITDIINFGINNSPESMGMGGQFYHSMWAGSHEDFVKRLESLYAEGDRMYDSAYYGTGNTGDIGLVKIYKEKGYVYVFIIDSFGNYRASLFTHAVIAGEYPDYREYKLHSYEMYCALNH